MPSVAYFSASEVQWIETQIQGEVAQVSSVSGGCINDAFQIELTDGREIFAKTNRSANLVDGLSMFVVEAEGLAQMALQAPDSVPEVLAVSNEMLLLEFLTEQPKAGEFWDRLAQQLAHLHENTFDTFGFIGDNFCGATVQPNPLLSNGFDFFAEHRLIYQVRLAFDKGLADRQLVSDVEKICRKLTELIPQQSAVLIHGDLWSGNCINTSCGPKLIDPACYYGWAEADLAMTQLFGGFSEEFYEHYVALTSLDRGWRERVPIYNLYHLLNHLNLFGGSYLNSVQQVLSRYR